MRERYEKRDCNSSKGSYYFLDVFVGDAGGFVFCLFGVFCFVFAIELECSNGVEWQADFKITIS